MITKHDHQVLFTALAFIAVVSKDGIDVSEGSASKINILAKLLGEFCQENVARPLDNSAAAYVEDKVASQIDAAIERHIDELRKDHFTVLPADRETLIQFYDRLHQRKARRTQWQFYATAKPEKLADIVLEYLDEEIKERDSLS